ncbi:peptidoglycan/LPS O-acetylase OafA/YrhL [Nitrobacter vulgaris]|uniref:acyltransferase family protein n=1 Tax=Nitrobacter vulgaris TaxID=29421 RepID=UPI00286248D3|nr:acyltransferase [Nitrobacter vulgaris]MDR6304501.1 peptidoglycan/LPS O-acetylase OafA/YrhL [Nitrobacter vulgaris]
MVQIASTLNTSRIDVGFKQMVGPVGYRRSVQIDVVRACAILLVMGAHLRFEEPDGIVGSIAWAWHEWGGFGVPLFFTLSGYLVYGLLLVENRNSGTIDVSRFLIRRSLKIWPAYFVFVTYLVAMPLLKGTATLSSVMSDYWPNVLFLNNYVGPNPALHTWSLAVEEQFYLLLAAFLVAFVRMGKASWIAPLFLLAPLIWSAFRAICALAGDPYLFDPTMPATHLWLDGLLVGAGVRAISESNPGMFAKLCAWRWPFIIGGIALMASLVAPWPNLNDVSLYRILPVRALASTFILIGMLHLSMTTWLHAMAARIGRYSYSIYLWHVTVLGITYRLFSPSLEAGNAMHWLAAVGGTVVAAILFGALTSQLIEWPVIKIRDRIFPSRAQESEPSALSGRRRSSARGLASRWAKEPGSARAPNGSWLSLRPRL